MSTMVVQEHHLWLNLDAPVSQAGLLGDTVEDYAQLFLAVQKQMEAIKCILRDTLITKPLRAGLRLPVTEGAPSAASTPALPHLELKEETLQQGCQTSRRKGFSGCHEVFPEDYEASLRRATRRWKGLLFGGHQHLGPHPIADCEEVSAQDFATQEVAAAGRFASSYSACYFSVESGGSGKCLTVATSVIV